MRKGAIGEQIELALRLRVCVETRNHQNPAALGSANE